MLTVIDQQVFPGHGMIPDRQELHPVGNFFRFSPFFHGRHIHNPLKEDRVFRNGSVHGRIDAAQRNGVAGYSPGSKADCQIFIYPRRPALEAA